MDVRKAVRVIVETFLSLEEAQVPEAETPDDVLALVQQANESALDGLVYGDLMPGFVHNFGYGPIVLSAQAAQGGPRFTVNVLSVNDRYPPDQAHRTWQRLRHYCRQAGVPSQLFRELVGYQPTRQEVRR